MERHDPIIIFASSTLPRGFADLTALLIVTIASLGLPGAWTVASVTILTLFLASQATILRSQNEMLALLAYGTSHRRLTIRFYVRGLLLASFATLPVFIITRFVFSSSFSLSLPSIVVTLLAAGVAYAIPSVRHVRSSDFTGLYKG